MLFELLERIYVPQGVICFVSSYFLKIFFARRWLKRFWNQKNLIWWMSGRLVIKVGFTVDVNGVAMSFYLSESSFFWKPWCTSSFLLKNLLFRSHQGPLILYLYVISLLIIVVIYGDIALEIFINLSIFNSWLIIIWCRLFQIYSGWMLCIIKLFIL